MASLPPTPKIAATISKTLQFLGNCRWRINKKIRTPNKFLDFKGQTNLRKFSKPDLEPALKLTYALEPRSFAARSPAMDSKTDMFYGSFLDALGFRSSFKTCRFSGFLILARKLKFLKTLNFCDHIYLSAFWRFCRYRHQTFYQC